MRTTKPLRQLICLAMLLCLCSCSLLPADDSAPVLPDLRQLSMPAAGQAFQQTAAFAAEEGAYPVDLWLDASQVAGGVSAAPESLFPHRSAKYREGGFHYRYDQQVGWYENVLRHMLAAAEGSRVRVLRNGNEQFSDELILSSGLAQKNDPALLSSLRRDLLTCAIDPMPTLFSTFSDETMLKSFYALYTPMMNQMAQFAPDGGQLLENPGQVALMEQFINEQIESYNPHRYRNTLSALLTDSFSPLMTALDNLAPGRLSVITCDPLTLRRLSGVAADGTPQAYLETLLAEKGIFDQGLTVGIYAFQLDYVGQITTVNAADLLQPMIWGRVDYDNNRKKTYGILPMPRILLTLVVGTEQQVSSYTQALNARLDSDEALKGLRGPEKGQLTYSKDGETVTQQPFSFAYHYTEISRHSVQAYSLSTPGAAVAVTRGTGALLPDAPQTTVALSTEQSGPCSIAVSFPVQQMEGGLTLDASQLPALTLEGVSTLLLTSTSPNVPDAPPQPEGVQTLPLRDTLYHFTYDDAPAQIPFTLEPLRLSADGQQLEAVLTVDSSALTPGYYRLYFHGEITGQQMDWPRADWTRQLNANVTNEQISSWVLISQAVDNYAKKSNNVPTTFSHAFGDQSGKVFRETVIPDCPPVYAVPRLNELLTQLENAARIDATPFMYCQLDVFVAPSGQISGL